MKTGKRIYRIIVWAITACTLAGLTGCYDDTDILAELEDQERRLAALEQVCERMNTNIASLQLIVDAMQRDDMISNVAPVEVAGKVIGYNLSFTSGGSVTVFCGNDGKDGRDGTDGKDGRDGTDGVDGKDGVNGYDSIPVIGVAMDEKGIWYWTLNGEWLLDSEGRKVRAVGRSAADGTDGIDGQDGQDGEDGKDGKDGALGMCPLLKIMDGDWYYSLDGGFGWTYICHATGDAGTDGTDGTDGDDGTDGKNGDTMFKSVVETGDNVVITLSDNTVITIPKEFPLEISFSAEVGFVNDTLVLPPMFDHLNLYYKVTSPTNEINVQVVTSADMGAYVIPDAEKPLEGVIGIKTLANLHVDLDSGQLLSKVLVIVANKTCTIMRTLVCQESKLVIVDHDRVDIRMEGGNLDFHYRTNTPVSISIPDSSASRCWQVKTKAVLADSVVTVHFEPNKGPRLRRTSVTVSNPFGVGRPASIAFYIYQDCDSEPIVFADSGLMQYLVDNPKVNLPKPFVFPPTSDNVITKGEASSVKSLVTLFGTGLTEGREYRRFNEFQYFTGITEIPDGSFNNWTQLDSISFPESITTIRGGRCGEEGIFQNCPALKSFKGMFTQNDAIVYNNQLLRVAPAVVYDGQFIPDGVEIIGNKAVRHSSTTDLFLPSSVKKIRDKAFEYSKIETVRFAMTTDDPQTGKAYVDSLAEDAFNHCFKLKRFIGPEKNGSLLVTPDRLGLVRDTTLYAYALGANATSFIIPEDLGVKMLAEGVFDIEGGTTSLKQIGLPSTLTRIRYGAFGSQANVYLYFRGAKPPKVEAGAFANTSAKTITIYVPAVMNGATVDATATNARIA